MGANATDPLVFPIAHYIGEQYSSETRTSTFNLRGGWSVAEVSREELVVWAAAHGAPDQLHQGRRWTREALVEAARPQVGDSTDRIVAGLLERDILAEVQPGSDEAVDFAKIVRLAPLRLGLGNTAEDPQTWRIGSDLDTPVVGVSHTVYNTWEWAHLYRNLWDSCQSLAKLRVKSSGTIPTSEGDCNPQVILYEVLETAHVLLASTSAYFDTAFDWGTV